MCALVRGHLLERVGIVQVLGRGGQERDVLPHGVRGSRLARVLRHLLGHPRPSDLLMLLLLLVLSLLFLLF